MKYKLFYTVGLVVLLINNSLYSEKAHSLVRAEVLAVDSQDNTYEAKLKVLHVYRGEDDIDSFNLEGYKDPPLYASTNSINVLLAVGDIGIFVLERSEKTSSWRVSNFKKYGVIPFAVRRGDADLINDFEKASSLAEVNERIFKCGIDTDSIFNELIKIVYGNDEDLALWAIDEVDSFDFSNEKVDQFYVQLRSSISKLPKLLQIKIDEKLCSRYGAAWVDSTQRTNLMLSWTRGLHDFSLREGRALFAWLNRAKQIGYLEGGKIEFLFFDLLHTINKSKK